MNKQLREKIDRLDDFVERWIGAGAWFGLLLVALVIMRAPQKGVLSNFFAALFVIGCALMIFWIAVRGTDKIYWLVGKLKSKKQENAQ